MKVKIKIDKVKDGQVFTSDTTVEVTLPLSYWPTSQKSGFSMDAKDGKGKYNGTSQIFNAPSAGELVLFDNSPTNPSYYAMITHATQDWDFRNAKIIFVCFKEEMLRRVLEGIKAEPEKYSTEQVFKNLSSWLGFDRTVDFCCELAKKRVNKSIEELSPVF